ncbi:VOC family protein [Pseudomonas entomophila]|uniref:2-oxoadipate dioxygenase/decarboxylase HglS n=1 Tax=Pseudomonas entomophila TaxID=312306 RepID=UPI0015E37BEC|nr:VOC family protein [Pseudomonas entomophila]MBA1189100.1 VOC family protein [Pseudomonas entomophila]
MSAHAFVSPDHIRAQFSAAMSLMYKQEVPLYGTLLTLVSDVNRQVLETQPALAEALRWTGDLERLDQERHGAIRVGTAAELATLARLFAVMGMQPVGYYDLSCAGVPVHSTAFRPVGDHALRANPFRVFTSLLRLELIDDPQLRALAERILAQRSIFTPTALSLIEQCERDGGLSARDAEVFVQEALQTFRWHQAATVTAEQYRQLHDQHRLIADVVAFKGPHINHLTPRTLDIDAIQAGMPAHGISPKAVIEGPPTRRHPILLRQTSFKALQEPVAFAGDDAERGSHTARFGEIEQRGAALTPKGRLLYDRLLDATRQALGGAPTEANADRYRQLLDACFADFPDDLAQMRAQGLAFFRYAVTDAGHAARDRAERPGDLQALIDAGHVRYEALVYEDFLPVSAAGIFQSNLGGEGQASYAGQANRQAFEAALGMPVADELALYAEAERQSLAQCAAALGLDAL